MIQGMDEKTLMEPGGKEDKRRAAVQYFVQNIKTHNGYMVKYVVCEILNFVNVLCQIYFLDKFLDGQFTQFGKDVIIAGTRNTSDPLTKVFPKMAKCTLEIIGVNGDPVSKQGSCFLGINALNEKIYILLWFWLHGLTVVTAIYLIYQCCTWASLKLRYFPF